MTKIERVPAAVTWVPAAVIVATAAIAAFTVWSIGDELPARIATHWDVSGNPDSFTSLAGVVTQIVALGLIIPGMSLGLGRVIHAERPMAALSVGLGVMLSLLSAGAVVQQRGLPDGAQAMPINGAVALALLCGLISGVVTAFLVRRRGPLPVAHSRVTTAPLGNANVAWTGRARTARIARTVFAALVLLALGFALWQVWVGNTSMVLPALIMAASALLSVAAFNLKVTIDRRGVRVTGLGVPWVTVPLETIEQASVTQVQALGDFGGWGVRIGLDGRRAVVTSSGEALLLERAGMPDQLITIDDARRAADVVNSLIAHREEH